MEDQDRIFALTRMSITIAYVSTTLLFYLIFSIILMILFSPSFIYATTLFSMYAAVCMSPVYFILRLLPDCGLYFLLRHRVISASIFLLLVGLIFHVLNFIFIAPKVSKQDVSYISRNIFYDILEFGLADLYWSFAIISTLFLPAILIFNILISRNFLALKFLIEKLQQYKAWNR